MSDAASTLRTGRRAVRHVPELDGIRGVAIAGVMALHFVGGITPASTVERIGVKVTGYGVWGVDLFFVLSGYLITGILFDTKASTRYLRDFYLRRMLRIFPLYYGVLLVLCVLVPISTLARIDPQLVETRGLQGWLWPYLTNFYLAPGETWSIPYVSHFWSLAIEEHFYLVWPLLILVLTRSGAMRLCVWLGITSLLLRVVFSLSVPHLLYANTLTPCRFDALCAGGWFALWTRGNNEPAARREMESLAAAGAVVLGLSVWHLIVPASDALVLPLRTTGLAVFFGVFIHAATWHPGLYRLRAALRAPWLRGLGKYSYGLYVFHGIVSYGIDRHSPEAFLSRLVGVHLIAASLQIALGVALSLLLAVASYELFEVHFLQLKKWFDYAGSKSGVGRLGQDDGDRDAAGGALGIAG